jgi:hypothetical protein
MNGPAYFEIQADEPECWQGYFQDPEHNTFGIFQVNEKAA